MWHCANDIFGYCTGEPEFDIEPKATIVGTSKEPIMSGGHCKLDNKTCGKFQATTILDPKDVFRLEHSRLKTTIVSKGNREKPDKKTEEPANQQGALL